LFTFSAHRAVVFAIAQLSCSGVCACVRACVCACVWSFVSIQLTVLRNVRDGCSQNVPDISGSWFDQSDLTVDDDKIGAAI